MQDVIKLISQVYTFNSIKEQVAHECKRQVFCTIDEVSRAEFFAAGEAGLKPSFVAVVAVVDYRGEKLLEFRGKRYGIYRTYRRSGDYMELYAEEKAGVV